jgi:hypothetical protein
MTGQSAQSEKSDNRLNFLAQPHDMKVYAVWMQAFCIMPGPLLLDRLVPEIHPIRDTWSGMRLCCTISLQP